MHGPRNQAFACKNSLLTPDAFRGVRSKIALAGCVLCPRSAGTAVVQDLLPQAIGGQPTRYCSLSEHNAQTSGRFRTTWTGTSLKPAFSVLSADRPLQACNAYAWSEGPQYVCFETFRLNRASQGHGLGSVHESPVLHTREHAMPVCYLNSLILTTSFQVPHRRTGKCTQLCSRVVKAIQGKPKSCLLASYRSCSRGAHHTSGGLQRRTTLTVKNRNHTDASWHPHEIN